MNTSWPPTLSIDVAPVLELFTGSNFYSDKDAAIREAVMNAIDAITRRQMTEPNLKPEIAVKFSLADRTVSVRDNGDGMDQISVSTLFTKVGASASRLVKGDSAKSSTIGEFGIGALSYFLVSDQYRLETKRSSTEPVGIRLSKEMLNGTKAAEPVDCKQAQTGTTVTLEDIEPDTLKHLADRFPYWFRSVEGLTVTCDFAELGQGGLTKAIRRVEELDLPPWIDRAELGPPMDVSLLSAFDGKGRVDVLYKGVFVERVEIDNLWGLEGAVHVDPKHFRPKLNREGFVGQQLKSELQPTLRAFHPLILNELIICVRDLLSDQADWSEYKAISFWLAIPRSDEYRETAKSWDDEFRRHKAFRILSDGDEEASIDDLVALKNSGKIGRLVLAPDRINPNTLVSQAIRVLRAQGECVIQGLQRADGFMTSASFNSNSTTWLLSVFGSELPPQIQVNDIVDDTLQREALADVYQTNIRVRAIRLGKDATPFVAVRNEIWLNIDSDGGKEILNDVCTRNQGHIGFWTACMLHSNGSNLDQVGTLLKSATGDMERLGLVRRQFLRSLL